MDEPLLWDGVKELAKERGYEVQFGTGKRGRYGRIVRSHWHSPWFQNPGTLAAYIKVIAIDWRRNRIS